MRALKVKLKDAERVKKELINKKCYDYNFKPIKDSKYIYFPVKDCNLETIEKDLPENKQQTIKDIVKLPEKLTKFIPSGFDVIGSIAILEIPHEIKEYEKDIAKAILKLHKNIKTVVKKASIHEGIFRTRRYKHLAGVKTKETIHKENNVMLKLNIEKVYFSERLAHERLRIAKQVKAEDVLVMFSGIGPYVFVIAKNSPAKKVIGIEINPEAHRYAVENKKINKTFNTDLYLGDVKQIIPKMDEKFDRIIMPLPKTGELFLATAFKAIKNNGIIHFYDFLHESEFPDKSIKKIAEETKKAHLNFKILKTVKCGAYSPGKYRTCTDFKVSYC